MKMFAQIRGQIGENGFFIINYDIHIYNYYISELIQALGELINRILSSCAYVSRVVRRVVRCRVAQCNKNAKDTSFEGIKTRAKSLPKKTYYWSKDKKLIAKEGALCPYDLYI